MVSDFVSKASQRKKSSDQKSGSIGNRRICSSFTWYVWFSPIRSISQQKLDHQLIRGVHADLDFIVKIQGVNKLGIPPPSSRKYWPSRSTTFRLSLELIFTGYVAHMSTWKPVNMSFKLQRKVVEREGRYLSPGRGGGVSFLTPCTRVEGEGGEGK